MPVPSPLHARTAALCTSYRWKEWAGCHAVCSFETTHDAEYHAVRHAAGLLDVSPLYKYEVAGRDAAELLAYLTVKDVRRLAPGRVTYLCWCDEHGHVLDDGTVTVLAPDRLRLTSGDPALAWLARHAGGFDVRVQDVTRATAALSIQGPTARAALATACADPAAVQGLRFFRLARTEIAGYPVEVTRTGYTGDLGYEVWCAAGDALDVWDAVRAAGRPHGLLPMGLDALDVTRVEAGFLLMGVDYRSARTCLVDVQRSTPDELGLGWAVDLDREPFLGRDAIRAERARGVAWAFVGLVLDWDALEALYAEHGLPPALCTHVSRDPVPVFHGTVQVGQATSRVWSPLLKRYLALATVRAAHAAPGTELAVEATVEFQRRTVPARVVRRPFFDPERKRATPGAASSATAPRATAGAGSVGPGHAAHAGPRADAGGAA